jgi:hypothetical protein
MLKSADRALSKAKTRGRGNHQFFKPDMSLRTGGDSSPRPASMRRD